MKYIISKTSVLSSEKPHELSKKEKFIDEVELSESFWTIEINDLNKFVEENGKIILSKIEDNIGYTDIPKMKIEIYDDYRE